MEQTKSDKIKELLALNKTTSEIVEATGASKFYVRNIKYTKFNKKPTKLNKNKK